MSKSFEQKVHKYIDMLGRINEDVSDATGRLSGLMTMLQNDAKEDELNQKKPAAVEAAEPVVKKPKYDVMNVADLDATTWTNYYDRTDSVHLTEEELGKAKQWTLKLQEKYVKEAHRMAKASQYDQKEEDIRHEPIHLVLEAGVSRGRNLNRIKYIGMIDFLYNYKKVKNPVVMTNEEFLSVVVDEHLETIDEWRKDLFDPQDRGKDGTPQKME